jgi:hypothetical protein
MMAIHPAQIGVINSAFTPTQDALDHARAVVSAFGANPDAGVIALKGKMIDAPHLKQALRLLSTQKSDVGALPACRDDARERALRLDGRHDRDRDVPALGRRLEVIASIEDRAS